MHRSTAVATITIACMASSPAPSTHSAFVPFVVPPPQQRHGQHTITAIAAAAAAAATAAPSPLHRNARATFRHSLRPAQLRSAVKRCQTARKVLRIQTAATTAPMHPIRRHRRRRRTIIIITIIRIAMGTSIMSIMWTAAAMITAAKIPTAAAATALLRRTIMTNPTAKTMTAAAAAPQPVSQPPQSLIISVRTLKPFGIQPLCRPSWFRHTATTAPAIMPAVRCCRRLPVMPAVVRLVATSAAHIRRTTIIKIIINAS